MPPNNPTRPTTRTPSIPIPGSAPRSIEDILNFSSITPSGTSTNAHRDRSQNSITRSLYSGLEGGRPSLSNRHVSASTSVGAVRPALGGGSGPPWGARSASASAANILPGNFGIHNIIEGFEPRVIGGGRSSRTSAERTNPATATAHDVRAGFPRRMSTGTRPTPPATTHGVPAGHRPSASLGYNYGHHIPGSGAPVAFPVPPYLRYSSQYHLLQTDPGPTVAVHRPTIFHPTGRDVTPVTESDEESESSGGFSRPPYHRERGRERERPNAYTVSSAILNGNDVLHLPTRWNDQDRGKYLSVSEDGRNLFCHGQPSSHKQEAAAARTNYPIPPATGIYYYEITVLDRGKEGHISVGFSCAGVKLNRLPGWEKNSWGYHGDDGKSFAGEREGTDFGPGFTTNDVIGCGIDFSIHKAFFTKNGEFLGYAFENIGIDNVELFPFVGLRTSVENIRANFGQEKFKFDIDYHVHVARENAWKKIQATRIRFEIDELRDVFELVEDKSALKASKSTETVAAPVVKTEVKQEPLDEEFVPIELPPDYSEPINKLVYTYLQHHGYERSAKALKAQIEAQKVSKIGNPDDRSVKKIEDDYVDIKMETDEGLPGTTIDGFEFENPFDLDRMDGLEQPSVQDGQQQRQRVVTAVQSGNIDLALRLLKDWFPAVYEVDHGFLLLKLKSRKFVELMLQASDALQAVKAESAASSEAKSVEGEVAGVMDVDDDAASEQTVSPSLPSSSTAPALAPMMKRSNSRTPPTPALQRYHSALADALAYGKTLNMENPRPENLSRPEVAALMKTTFSLVTYDDPRLAPGEDIRAFCSPDVRTVLAQEVNQAILESQGRPSRPALERLYRQTSVVLTQLALMGVGDAAFADMHAEFLGSSDG